MEVGDPQIVVDNTSIIKSALNTGGCSMVGMGAAAGGSSAAGLLLGTAGVLLARRRRR